MIVPVAVDLKVRQDAGSGKPTAYLVSAFATMVAPAEAGEVHPAADGKSQICAKLVTALARNASVAIPSKRSLFICVSYLLSESRSVLQSKIRSTATILVKSGDA